MISALPSCAPLLVVPYFCAVYFCDVYFCDVWYRVAAQLGSRLASPDEVRLQSMSIVVPCATLVREFLFLDHVQPQWTSICCWSSRVQCPCRCHCHRVIAADQLLLTKKYVLPYRDGQRAYWKSGECLLVASVILKGSAGRVAFRLSL